MNIIIKDDQGLDTALMMDGYSREQRIEAKQTIRAQFRDTAIRVFQDVLGRRLPETITVSMAISNREELKGESAARLADYYSALSKVDSAVFTIREITIKTLLNHGINALFKSTVIHEMFHAADYSMLEENHKLFRNIQNKINVGYSDFNKEATNSPIALMKILQVFNHYRAEGIAILGESLLMRSPFATTAHATAQFCKVFELTMMKAQMKIGGQRDDWDVYHDASFHKAYAVAPIILLLVLDKRSDVQHDLVQKALEGLNTGDYELTDDDVKTIMRAALALTLTGFIQGLTTLGEDVAPIRPFLNLCSALQQDEDEDNTLAYEKLILQPKSEENFNAAMDQIMGCCMPEEELDGLCKSFIEYATDEPLYPQLKEKVKALYNIFKNEENVDKKRIAQWALTYFFDDEDIIHDDVSGLGLVDDITVIDYAIHLSQP